MIKINGIPIKTRVPPTVWAIAGLLTLVSIFEVILPGVKTAGAQ
jgi:hypothetical protein